MMAPHRRGFVPTARATVAVTLCCAMLLIGAVTGVDTWLRHVPGLSSASAPSLASIGTIIISPSTPAFGPPVTVIARGGRATFVNKLGTFIRVRTAALSPHGFALLIAPHTRATVRLTQPGLYHYYDALSAHPLHVVAGNAVIAANSAAQIPRQGWIAVIPALPSLRESLLIPQDQDLFTPKAMVAVVGSTIAVANHDTDAHNFVIDPASPTGAAFVISGSQAEPPSGWQRVLVVQQAGLYHIYCTLHTKTVKTLGGWHLVVPRHDASGYRDHNPMEAWIVVLPATTTT